MTARSNRSPKTTPLALNEFLCFAVYSANHAFNRVYQPLLKDIGLTYPQFIAMVLLWEQDGITVGNLGQKLSLQSNTLTPMLKRMEALGYINRRRDTTDERQVRIELTTSGRQLQDRASAIVRAVRAATGTQDDTVERLTRQVNELRAKLESKKRR